MALKRNERYPGRYSNPTTDHPQGAFKNRTAPSAQDGSYLEQDWTNDWDGFFGRLLTVAGITPNGDVDTALSSQYYDALKSLFLSRADPFGDIKADGATAVSTALENLGLGAGAPPIGIPFFWPLAAMPNTVMDEWSDMVFLKPNGASFSAAQYPKLAKVWTGLVIPDMRGEFLRIWDDGRGVDSGRALLSAQSSAAPEISAAIESSVRRSTDGALLGTLGNLSGALGGVGSTLPVSLVTATDATLQRYISADFKASRSSGVYQAVSEIRPYNRALNFLVRAK